MYMGGAAGTGKSHVITCVCALYRRFGVEKSVVVTAYTGAAAVILHASTLHSVLKLPVSGAPSANVPVEVRQRFEPVTLLVIDEVSMMGTALMRSLDTQLRRLKNSAKEFGGLSILFAGDFCQLPPVGAMSLMKESTSDGRTLWKQHVRTCVFLTQQMRQADDPEFAMHLQSLRELAVTSLR
jgi:ATP-dependent DNA helicase PIF1